VNEIQERIKLWNKMYILHSIGVMVGDTILFGLKAPISIGNALPLS
jgi:ribosomal protein L2